MSQQRYLDANATQPLRPAARDAVLAALEVTGNPSSVHGPGRGARRLMEDAREAIAGCFGGHPERLVFTSGGTEADALAVHALSTHAPASTQAISADALSAHALSAGRRIIISAIEHDAIRSAAPDACVVPVGADGIIELDALEHQLSDGVASLVCLMLANNETGCVQPVREAAAICRRFGALLHVDAVQAAGRMPVRLDALNAHSLAISSHKLGGPAGSGALLLAADCPFSSPVIGGGGQERGRRGGTQAVALIAGFAAAACASQSDDLAQINRLRDAAERAAVASGAVVCGDPRRRLANTTCIALPGVAASMQVIALDLEKIAVSAGAACSSGKMATSHVLRAMGLGALAGQAIRISLAWNATQADIDDFATAYARVAARLRPALVPRPA